LWGGGRGGLKIGRLGTHGRGSRVPSLPILSPPRPPPHESEDSELMAAFREFRVFRVVGWWAGRAQNRKTRNSNGPEASSESSDFEARRPGGPQNWKIRNSNGPEASSESSDFRLCFPAEGAARLGRARGLWTEGGEGGGWREGLGDWLAVGSRFASTDCSWIYRGEVGLEVG
jgi:hypothetical protein